MYSKFSASFPKTVWTKTARGLLVAVGFFAFVTTGPASANLPAGTVVQGSVNVTLNLAFSPALAAGSVVSCSVALISNDVRAPSDSQFASITTSGTSAVCKINVPYKWLVSSTSSTMTITYSVSDSNHAASAIYDTIKVPSGTTNVTVAVTL